MIKKEVEKILQYVQKPARYAGGELNSVVKNADDVSLRYAFCFPDTYEIGMSHLGMKIIYGLVNEREDAWCERVFAPDSDMEEQMRKNNVPLFALESGDYIKDFDIIGNESNSKCIVTYGREFSSCYEAMLEANNAFIVKLNKIKPISKSVFSHFKNVNDIYFFEEGIKSGGIGEVFASMLAQSGVKSDFHHICVNDEFIKQASVQSQL